MRRRNCIRLFKHPGSAAARPRAGHTGWRLRTDDTRSPPIIKWLDFLDFALLEEMIDPQRSQLFGRRILTQPGMKMVEIDEIEILILVKATEDHSFFAGLRVDMSLKALGTNLLHHALHGGIYGADCLVMRRGEMVSRPCGELLSQHPSSGSDPIEMIRSTSHKGIRMSPSLPSAYACMA